MFESGEEPEVSQGLSLMNDLVVPCIPLLLAHDADGDLMAVEDMRNRWCSYLGQEMERRFLAGPPQISSSWKEQSPGIGPGFRFVMHSEIRYGICTGILSGFCSGIYSRIRSGFIFRISYGIRSEISSVIPGSGFCSGIDHAIRYGIHSGTRSEIYPRIDCPLGWDLSRCCVQKVQCGVCSAPL